MFFLVEPSTGVALPILAGRTQLYGRFKQKLEAGKKSVEETA